VHLQLLKMILYAAKIAACLGISRSINTDIIMLGGLNLAWALIIVKALARIATIYGTM
jgi:hypothetical protein